MNDRPRLGYRPALDGLRAVAIAAVIGCHYFHRPRAGYLGVDLFFVLSGFLITTLLLEEHQRSGRISLRAFYVRRARRLLPALFTLLAAFLLVEVAAMPFDHTLPHELSWVGLQAAVGAFYVSNFFAAWYPDLARLSHLWSLAMEEQFYLLWPLIVVFAVRRRVTPNRLLALLLITAAAVWLNRVSLWLAGAPVNRLYYTPDVVSDSLLIGCAAGVVYVHRIESIMRRMTQLAPLALAVVAGYLVLGPSRIPVHPTAAGWPLWKTVIALLSACCVIAAAQSVGLVTRVLSIPALVFVGRISYGLYLWHPFFVWVLNVPPLEALPLTFATATLSYYTVERAFLRRRPEPAPAGAVLTPARALTG
jgi:peptidoglycan/LPS O-acetylase OafA/YrhL